MKKLISFFILLSVMCCSTVAHSHGVKETNPGFVLLDIMFYRPMGLAGTIIGAGAFVGLSPLTALASIPAPHDAFAKTFNILILAPAAYTFNRPLGEKDFQFHAQQHNHKPAQTQGNTEPNNNSVIPE